MCRICFEEFPFSVMKAAACKHYFCKDCWKGYATEAITNGPACLDLRCPSTECKPKAAVSKCQQHAHASKKPAHGTVVDQEDYA